MVDKTNKFLAAIIHVDKGDSYSADHTDYRLASPERTLTYLLCCCAEKNELSTRSRKF